MRIYYAILKLASLLGGCLQRKYLKSTPGLGSKKFNPNLYLCCDTEGSEGLTWTRLLQTRTELDFCSTGDATAYRFGSFIKCATLNLERMASLFKSPTLSYSSLNTSRKLGSFVRICGVKAMGIEKSLEELYNVT
ncbi:hypothetical protein L6164_029119 [Bauhinia variegata]|uniref:Uncharacterized protein n=1 Tax=Bauhinia variegata TaxID=167791 RepID=A0ACB9L9K2_BAUVA|nr:hypothetical protein L6164_029119 [Bauhinia variegata]